MVHTLSRWNHGLLRIGETLYAVGGCGQQNSMEVAIFLNWNFKIYTQIIQFSKEITKNDTLFDWRQDNFGYFKN